MTLPKLLHTALLFTAASRLASAFNFTVANGQIYTPGLAILNAPQPGTPLGGELIEVSLDVSTNGRLALPPYPSDSPSQIHNITIFLYSYITGRNFTISNGTASANNASLGEIMLQEPGSTVKHVKWLWPDCLVGDGQPKTPNSDRGAYNISIRQSFRLNGEDHYTIFDVPISVTNSIEERSDRPSCGALDNALWTPEDILESADFDVPALFAPGDSTVLQTSENTNGQDGLGPAKPPAGSGQGLGSGASSLADKGRMSWVLGLGMVAAMLLP